MVIQSHQKPDSGGSRRERVFLVSIFLVRYIFTYSSFGSMSMHVQCRHRNPNTRVDLRMRTNNSRRAMRVREDVVAFSDSVSVGFSCFYLR